MTNKVPTYRLFLNWNARENPEHYRPEIDGLRAIAVVAVIIYHLDAKFLGLPLLKGGFLGVDVFFVISGYLITGIILRGMRSGTFSLATFYERRARRILPALLTVVLVTLPAAYAWLLPNELTAYAASALATIAFGSNIWFHLDSSYFAQASLMKPLLHTWSLAVEEQFYVLYPLFVAFIFRRRPVYMCSALAVALLFSLQLSEYTSNKLPTASFYFLPTRAWELLAGAILAVIEIEFGRPTSPILRKTMPALGLFLIGKSLVFFSAGAAHPGFTTLPVCVGTYLLIAYMGRGEIVSDIVSSRPFVALGLISYSLYLWHFPILAFARVLRGETLSGATAIVCVGISAALAFATYRLIETPMRAPKSWPRRPFLIAILAAALVSGVAAGIMYFSNGLPARFGNLSTLIAYDHNDRALYRSGTCNLDIPDMVSPPWFDKCPADPSTSNLPSILVWGDSHAAHLFPGLLAVYGGTHRIVQRTSSGCPPILDMEIQGRPTCKPINDFVMDLAVKTRPEKVILAGAWWLYDWRNLKRTIESLRRAGISNIVLFGPVPLWHGSLSKQLVDHMSRNVSNVLPERMRAGLETVSFDLETEMRRYFSDSGAAYFSPLGVFCNEAGCLTNIDGGPGSIVAWDYAHLTRAGSEYLIEAYAKVVSRAN